MSFPAKTRIMRLPAAVRAALLAGVLPLAAGCGGGSGNGGSPAGGPGGTGARVLTVATAEVASSVDPAMAFDTWSTAIVHAVTRRLVDYDQEAKLVPDLAENWEASSDGKTYTFHLKADAKFADGTPIEARHFQAAVQRVQDPETGSPGADFFSGITGVEAPDARTLVVKLKSPDPTLPNVMGMTFAAPIQEGQDPMRPAASGPYQLETFEPGSQVVLKKNPNDPAAAGWVDRIVIQLKVEEPLQMTRVRNGEVDLLPGIPPAEYARIMQDPSEKDNVAQGVVNQTWYFGVNVTHAPWNDPRVREAAFLALNRANQVSVAGAGQVANAILPPYVPAYEASRKLPDQDIARAKQLLQEAGYTPGKKPVMWLSNSAIYQRRAELIQSDLSAIGIPVELRPVTFSEYRKGYRNDADCWYGGWYPDFPDAGNFLEPVFHSRNIGPGKNNAAHYRNPQVDRLLEKARVTPPGDERIALYRQAEDILLKDLPWMPLYFEMETRYFRDGVEGVVVHPVWRQMLTGIRKQ